MLPWGAVRRERPDGATKLTGSGRLIDDFEIFLSFDSGKFDVEDASKVSLDILKRQAPTEYKILHALDDGPKTYHETWTRLNEGASPEYQISKSQMGNALKSLAKKGLVKKPDRQGGVYNSHMEGKL